MEESESTYLGIPGYMPVKPPHPAGDSQTTYIPTVSIQLPIPKYFRPCRGGNPYRIGMKLRMKVYNLPTCSLLSLPGRPAIRRKIHRKMQLMLKGAFVYRNGLLEWTFIICELEYF